MRPTFPILFFILSILFIPSNNSLLILSRFSVSGG